MKSNLQTSTAAENAAVFRNILSDVPSWDLFIKTLDAIFNDPSESHTHEDSCGAINNKACNCLCSQMVFNKNKCTDILVHDKLHFVYWGVANGLGEGPMFKYAKQMASLFFREDTLSWGAKSLINLAGNENELSIHKDDHNVMSWQCQGSVEYRIYEDTEDDFAVPINPEGLSYTSYILNPGDIIYIPTGVVHQAIAFEPRATLIIQSPPPVDFIPKHLI